MTDFIPILLALALGSVLAGSYFGGLWWTVRQLPLAGHPSVLYFGSLLFRLAMLLSGFFVVLVYGDWPGMAACLIAFLGTRLVVVHLLARGVSPVSHVKKEA